uniref:Uncharacterized protein n=1 Tax=Arundo donax TaxID=35708 RepID=A0A0A8YUG5_ARUDO
MTQETQPNKDLQS